MHGGALGVGAPKGNQNGSKLGIYARFMSQADQDSVANSQIGSLEAEIQVVKAQLTRTLAAQKAYDECVEAGEIPTKHLVLMRMAMSSVTKSDTNEESGAGDSGKSSERTSTSTTSDKVLERPDFESLIDRWTSRIERLEKAHALLQGSIDGDPDDEDGLGGNTIRVKIIGGLPD